MTASVYVHLPFCVHKCAYCDFESYAGRLSLRDSYIDAVLREAEQAKETYGSFGVPTVYFGGGTPSLLEPEQLARLCEGLFSVFPPDADAEITMEANPGTVSREKLDTARRCGIDRLSLGVQSSDDAVLVRIGRIHDFAQAVQAFEMARAAGFENISCDLMYGLPGQDRQGVLASVRDILSLGPEHISCYSLIPEEGTPLGDAVLQGKIGVPDDEEVLRQQDAVIDALEARGYHRYEISNYAVTGYESRHNCAYWTGQNYLGLGCAAHSFMNGERFSNPDLASYMEGKRHVDREFVDERGRLEEKLLLETRLTRGIRLAELEAGAAAALEREAEKLRGLVTVENGRLRITRAGYNVHNEVVFRLIEALGPGSK